MPTLSPPASRDNLSLSGYSKLRPWYGALANRRNRLVQAAVLGGSLAEGYPVTTFDKTVSQQLSAILNANHPTPGLSTHGRGFIGVPTAVTLGTGWPQAYTGGSFDDATLFTFGAKHRYWYTSSGSDKVVHTVGPDGLTSFDIRVMAGSSGNASGGYYKINGGSAVSFSTFNASTILRTITVAGTLAAGSTIEVGRTAGTLIFTGITEWNGDEAKGIQVHNFGHASYSAAQWAVVNGTPTWVGAIASFNLDLLIIQDLGVNDGWTGNGNKSASQFKTSMTSLIAQLRAGGITCPIVLAADYDMSDVLTFVSPWQDYVTAMREIAAADSTVVFLDHSARMPAHGAAATYGLYNGSDIHGNANGAAYLYMAENTYAAIRPR